MSFIQKLRDSLAERIAEAAAASVTVLLGWAAYQIAPVLLPVIEASVPKRALLALFVTSAVLNLLLLVALWFRSSRGQFVLKYGIYWDRNCNPHCPSCKIPVAAYGSYQVGGKGYYCKPCKKVFNLADATGKDIDPEQVIRELLS